MVSQTNDGDVQVWEVATGRELSRLRDGVFPANDARFAGGRSLGLTAGTQSSGRVWEPRTGRITRVLDDVLRFSTDGQWAIRMSEEKSVIEILSTTTGAVATHIGPFPEPIAVALFTADGGRVLTGGPASPTQLWETNTGRCWPRSPITWLRIIMSRCPPQAGESPSLPPRVPRTNNPGSDSGTATTAPRSPS